MKKSWLALAGAAAVLSSCVANVEVFSAVNLRVSGTEACTTNGTARELNLAFTYAGDLRGLNMTFTPNGKPPQSVNIPNLRQPPTGFRIDTLNSNEARLFINLEQITPTSPTPMGIEPPVTKTLYPMTIDLEAIGTSTNAKIKLSPLQNVDVGGCYSTTAQPNN